MKHLVFFLLVFLWIDLFAQTPNYSIVVSEPTNDDTLLTDLLGVISGPLPPPGTTLPDITPQLQDIGVTSIRNNGYRDDKLDMEAMFRCPSENPDTVPCWYCDPHDMSNYHFEASDTLFRAIRDGGFSIFFRLGGENQSALPNQVHVFHGPQDTVAENNLIQAFIPVVEHYDNFEGNSDLLDYLDIWTEWPNTDFWERPDDEFIWFFTKAFDTLKTHFPDKKIGGPGFLVPTEKVINGETANKAVDLLNSLYTHNLKPDFISWHLWSIDPERYYWAGERFRQLLDGTGPFSVLPWAGTNFFDNVEIICGAWGTPPLYSDGTPLPPDLLYKYYNGKEGAALLTADWIAMQQTNTQKAYYYRCADFMTSGPDTTVYPAGGSGLFYANYDVDYKPKAYAFKMWSQIYNEFPQKLSCDFPVYASDSSKLYVLTSKNNLGGYGFLVSNTEYADKTFDITINGLTVDTANYDIYYYLVNDDNNGDVEMTNYSTHFSIPEQSVELIRIVPKNYTYSIEKREHRDIAVYPNPTTGILTINLEESARPSRVFNCEVIDINGRVIKSYKNISSDNLQIDLSNQSKGLYFLKVYNDELVKNVKIILE